MGMRRGGGGRTGRLRRGAGSGTSPIRTTPDRQGGRRKPTSRDLARWLPAALIIGGLAFDLSTPSRFTGSPFFSAAPLVAAPFFSLRATATAGIAAGLAVVTLHLVNRDLGAVESVTELVTVLTVAVLALFINRVVRRSGRELASARSIAEAAQRAVLPTPDERIGGFHVAARYEAAQTDARIGGDLYAVQDTPYGVRLIVGDVRGKGLDAVEAVAVVIGAFREAAEQEATLVGVAARLERALQRERQRHEGPDRSEGFTTAVLAEVPTIRRTDTGAALPEPALRILNRGHPSPLLLYADGGVFVADPVVPALPLGLGELADQPERVDEFAFPEGATLLLFTDGMTEARDANGVFYDPQERLRGRLFSGPDALLDALVEDVARHTAGGAADDMALLAVSRPAERQPMRRRAVGIVRGAGDGSRSGHPSDGP
ncbi:PP2C family protein-serine/threonine phosphatase [Streptomyces sp. NPDC004647]|uniref:PP2C family protein-serine/threonine phosphatase n=1 Tax=Streptomyces sp. NPDC004647 TaxID=3154671 RepID=UPI0033A36759